MYGISIQVRDVNVRFSCGSLALRLCGGRVPLSGSAFQVSAKFFAADLEIAVVYSTYCIKSSTAFATLYGSVDLIFLNAVFFYDFADYVNVAILYV